MSKLLIKENQLALIINHIKNNIIITEGLKDIVMGTALLLDLKLTGINKTIGEKAVNNPKIMSQIKSNLEDDKIIDFAKTLESAGFSNALDKIEKNIINIETNFNNYSHKNNMGQTLIIKHFNNK